MTEVIVWTHKKTLTYLAFMSNLWSVCCVDIFRNWPCYGSSVPSTDLSWRMLRTWSCNIYRTQHRASRRRTRRCHRRRSARRPVRSERRTESSWRSHWSTAWWRLSGTRLSSAASCSGPWSSCIPRTEHKTDPRDNGLYSLRQGWF